MSTKSRRHFTPEEKTAILRLHLIEKQSVSEVCNENNLIVSQFYAWQKMFFENGAAAFKAKRTPKIDSRDKVIADLKAKIIDRDEGIAELMMEHVKLKKKLFPI